VQDAADAAKLLTAAGPPRAAVDEIRHRGTVPGALLGARTVEHHDAPVLWRYAEHYLTGDFRIGREQRAAETSRPSLASSTASSSVPYGMTVFTGRTLRCREAR